MGVNLSQAINMYFKQIEITGSIPFTITSNKFEPIKESQKITSKHEPEGLDEETLRLLEKAGI